MTTEEPRMSRSRRFLELARSAYRHLRGELLLRTPRGIRRLLYRKPTNWAELAFHQKVAWRCQHPDPEVNYRRWVDKALVKETVRPYFRVAQLFDLVEAAEQIDTARLPATYVMKATHSWNMGLLIQEGVIQGENRSLELAGLPADNETLGRIARRWLNPRRNPTRHELQYLRIPPRILFEEFLDPIDYELHLFLFYGVLKFTTVAIREGFHHCEKPLFRLYDADWRQVRPNQDVPFVRFDRSPREIPPPSAPMLAQLSRWCEKIDQVRADFFMVGGEPYFSEFTFTHNAGGVSLLGEYEEVLGRFWT